MAQNIVSNEIKQKNRTGIFSLFRSGAQLSRQDIVTALDLSLPTVTNNLEELKAQGLIAQTGSFGNTGGRRARAYSLVANARTAIGLDITRHHVTAVAVDLQGTIIISRRRRLDFERTDAYYKELGNIVRQIVTAAELDEQHILGVGIGVPGLLTADSQRVYYSDVLGITGATCTEFSKYIPYSAILCHDTDSASFAEMWTDPGTKNAFYIMLSASVGGSISIGGQRYIGSNLRSGEVGHMLLVPDGKRCYCGRRGCVDPYCSASALTGVTGGDLKQFFQQLEAGDAAVRSVWQEYLSHLAVVVANLRMLFDCDIIIGGYVGSFMDAYIDQLRELVAERNPFDNSADYVRPCRCKTEAIAAGSALNYISEFLNSI